MEKWPKTELMGAMTIESEYLAETGPQALFTRVSRMALLLEDFQHRAFDPFGLRFVDFSVLRVLQQKGPPYQLSPTRLSEVVVRSTGGMTQIVDRLERVGLVERSPDPSDRRKVIVGLTAAGLELVNNANAAWQAQKEDLFGRLENGRLEELDSAVQALLQLFTEDHEGHKASS